MGASLRQSRLPLRGSTWPAARRQASGVEAAAAPAPSLPGPEPAPGPRPPSQLPMQVDMLIQGFVAGERQLRAQDGGALGALGVLAAGAVSSGPK